MRAHPMRDGLVALAATLAALAMPAAAMAQYDEVRRARVGEPLLLKFQGHREAGFQWTLNEAESRGAELVAVEEVGWTMARAQGSLLNPQPATVTLSVLPKAPGEADLRFEYYRPWGNRTVVRARVVRVTIAPAAN